MVSVPTIHERNADLNPLTVFEALMNEGNVTRAAYKLSLTQPTVSNKLRRLRETYGDPLFVRNGAGSLNIHLHWLVLDGVCRCGGDGVSSFVEAGAPTCDALQTLIARLMKLLTRRACWWKRWARLAWPSRMPAGNRRAHCGHCRPRSSLRMAFGPRAGGRGRRGAQSRSSIVTSRFLSH